MPEIDIISSPVKHSFIPFIIGIAPHTLASKPIIFLFSSAVVNISL